MNKQKIPYRSPKNKYIPLFCSFILFFSILTPVSAHYLANNQSFISQNNTNKSPTRPSVSRIRQGYKKNLQVVRPIKGATTATVRRGSCKNKKSQIELTILAPSKGNGGQATSKNPTLAWYVSDSETYPIRLFLYREVSDNKQELLYSTNIDEIQSKQGIMKHQLPKSIKLFPNTSYTWQVKIYCNPNRPSRAFQDKSDFKLVEIPDSLKLQIEAKNDPLDKAEIYAQAGLWYDAFEQILLAPKTSSTQHYQLSLLKDLALEEKDRDKDLEDKLQQIINKLNLY